MTVRGNALKIPVITTKIPGCEDAVVDDYNGLLCNPKDTHDLFSKMEKILKLSSAQIYQMGLNGRNKMKKEFDENIIISEYLMSIKKFK